MLWSVVYKTNIFCLEIVFTMTCEYMDYTQRLYAMYTQIIEFVQLIQLVIESTKVLLGN